MSFGDINNFNRINLKAFPHMVIGLFVYQDLDDNGVFSKDFKGDPLEPYGFSLNPAQDYQKIESTCEDTEGAGT